MNKNKLLEDILIAEQIVTKEQLQTAIKNQSSKGGSIGENLLALGLVSEKQLALAIAKQLNISYVDLEHADFKPAITQLLPESYARRYNALVLKQEEDKYLVVMADPSNIFAYDEIARVLKKSLLLGISEASNLIKVIDLVYRHREEISGFAEELSEEMQGRQVDISEFSVDVGGEEAPVVKLLQSLFTDAVSMQASDIHIEPDESCLRIRQRIDGELQETLIKKKKIIQPLILRLKLMAGLNIAERRIPQDGRFSITVDKQHVDVRLSTMPIQYGEAVVMRLLNQSQNKLRLSELGVMEAMQEQMRGIFKRPFGMMLVTGPTGSGKTTTLYSILEEINVPEKKIITVEDPVEYRLPRINQVQINEVIGLSFSRVLHSALRHDPNIIMIGEIRDEETASISLRAAMTGHLVLTTLHTNDASSSALRLIGMGVDSFLVATALTAVLAQRLVRRVCSKCVMKYEPMPVEDVWLKPVLGEKYANATFKVGRGCSYCNGTGYRGRIGIFELLEFDRDMVRALQNNNTMQFFDAVAANKAYMPLGLTALELATQGITTISETIRVIGQITDEISRGFGQKLKDK